MAGFSQIQGPAYRRHHIIRHGDKIRKRMAGAKKPDDSQTQRLWPMGHYPKDRGGLQHVEPDLFYTTATGGEDHEIHSPPLSNGNVSVPHTSCRWGTESNPMLDKNWVSHTRQVEVHLIGMKREHLDLGLWGRFKLCLFIEEPMRCFKCQRFLHHKTTCHNPVCCAICSSRLETSICIKKHKEGQATNDELRKLQREPSCMES